MDLLRNEIRHYAWGSTSAIPDFLGTAPDGSPVAELWISAHPLGSSIVLRPDGEISLDDLVRLKPQEVLGERVRSSFADRLPFLMKVIAPGSPLSIQVHPDLETARQGYEAAEAAEHGGTGPEPGNRTYLDPFHKPEMLFALTPFELLCGFRSAAAISAIFAVLGLEALCGHVAQLHGASGSPSDEGAAIRGVFEELTRLPAAEASALVNACVARAKTLLAEGCSAEMSMGTHDGLRTMVETAHHFPDDVGVVVSAMLNRASLEPGESIYVGSGVVHCYLSGLGIEIMAASDNVLRAGLTPKHLDVPELLRIAKFAPSPVEHVDPELDGHCALFAPTVAEFEMRSIVVEQGDEHVLELDGPKLALAVDGTIELAAASESCALSKGESVLIYDATGSVRVLGNGQLVVGSVPQPR